MDALLKALSQTEWALERRILSNMAEVVLRHVGGEKLSNDQVTKVIEGRPDDEADVQVIDGVAVIPVQGIISKRLSMIERSSHLGTSTGDIQTKISRALDDPNVRAIVLNIDSPGGSVSGIVETSNLIAKADAKKPVIAYASDLMASAAYWLGSQSRWIVGDDTAQVGSIGVYTVMVDSSAAAGKLGYSVHVVGSGYMKGAGQPGTEITDEQLAAIRQNVEDISDVFVRHVARGRAMSVGEVTALADGNLWIGKKALKAGLLDKVGSLGDAIAAAKRAASGKELSASSASEDVLSQGVIVMPKKVAVEAPTDGEGAVESVQAVPAIAGAVQVDATVQVADRAEISAAALKAERARCKEIRAIAAKVELDQTFVDKHIDAGSSIEDVHVAALNALSKTRADADIRVGENLNIESFRKAAADAFCIRAGIVKPNEKPHPRAEDFAGMRLLDVCREHLRAHGRSDRGMKPGDIARLVFRPRGYVPMMASGGAVYGHSTSDFPLILEDAINKSITAGYEEAPRSWSQWMRRKTVNDFKTVKVNRMGEFPALTQVREGEEYTYATIGEQQETYALAKYGKLFDVTWEAIVNDDLDAFTRVPMRMGQAAARLENVIAYQPIIAAVGGETMADGVVLFHADHGNLAGTGAALSVTSLGAAKAAMRTQTGVTAGVTINVEPRFLIVPAALETVAQQLLIAVNDPAIAVPTPNVFNRSLQLVVEPLLENSAYTGYDVNAWYLAASSGAVDTIEVAFLDGNETPFLEETEGTNVDGRRYKVRHVVAAKAIDWRGMYKNAGPS